MFVSRPLVEDLPASSTSSAPGWAYVPDVGIDPVKAGHRPANRKRRAPNAAASAASSSRQEAARVRKLVELDRDNARDVAIPVPARGKERARGKTANTRKILQAQRTFANYLADEEAWTAQGGSTAESAPAAAAASSTTRHAATAASTSRAKPPPVASKRPGSATVKRESLSSRPPGTAGGDTEMPDFPDSHADSTVLDASAADLSVLGSQPDSAGPPPAANPFWKPPSAPALLGEEERKLVRTNVPDAPTEEEMRVLTHAAPLSFAAARAEFRDGVAQKPRRFFCELCGYRAPIRCTACGGRLCGALECKVGHEEGRCVKYGA